MTQAETLTFLRTTKPGLEQLIRAGLMVRKGPRAHGKYYDRDEVMRAVIRLENKE